MKKQLVLVLLSQVLLLMSSCGKSNTNKCYQENPLEELAWLKKIKSDFDRDMSPQIETIAEYRYQAYTYFLIDICSGCTDAPTTIYHCDGTVFCEYGGISGKNTCDENFMKNKVLVRVWYNQ